MTDSAQWPAPPGLAPARPSADDDPAWVWIVNLVLAVIVLAAALGLLLWLASAGWGALFESDDPPDGTSWLVFLGIVLAIAALPIAVASIAAVICAAIRNRAAFVLNIVIGSICFSAGFPLLLVPAGVAGLVLTTDRRRLDRSLAAQRLATGPPDPGPPPGADETNARRSW